MKDGVDVTELLDVFKEKTINCLNLFVLWKVSICLIAIVCISVFRAYVAYE